MRQRGWFEAGLGLGGLALFGLLFGWFKGDHTEKDWLYAFGGSAEFFGVVLVAWPELVPAAERAHEETRKIASATTQRLSNLGRSFLVKLRLRSSPPGRIVSRGTSAVNVKLGLAVSGLVSTDGTPEKQLVAVWKWLRTHEESITILSQQMRKQPDHWRADIESARGEIGADVTRAIQAIEQKHFGERVWGVSLLLAGVILSTLGNLA